MANVKGVILNGAKYELLDAEARQLAGDAINQVETLENTVAAVETDVAVVKTDLATVAETATEAKTTATEANTLATQAETRAQEAYELAEKAGSNCNFVIVGTLLESYKTYEFTDTECIALFGKTLAQMQDGDNYLIELYGAAGNEALAESVNILKVVGSEVSVNIFNEGAFSMIITNDKIKIINITETSAYVIVKATKQL